MVHMQVMCKEKCIEGEKKEATKEGRKWEKEREVARILKIVGSAGGMEEFIAR